MKSQLFSLCFVALAFMLAPFTTQAATPSESLEKGIYQEETTGNLEAAIKIYREVLRDARKTKSLAAQAQYRLGRCLLKQGKKAEAQKALETLIEEYPKEAKLVEAARKLLPQKLVFEAPPWKSGESVTLAMRLPGGQTIGVLGTKVVAGKRNGKDVWEMSLRRHISGGLNGGISSAIVDQKTNSPIFTNWDHTLLGSASAQWSAKEIVITKQGEDGKPETKKIKLDSPAYANDQFMFNMRQLPLKVGYKATIPIRVAFTGGNAFGMEITVSKKEKIETPVGEFDCFRLDTNIAQTFWIADAPQRYIARFDAGGVSAVLSEINTAEVEATANKELGVSFTKPAGWLSYAHNNDNPKATADYRLVSPDSLTWVDISVSTKDALKGDRSESIADWADAEIKKAKNVFGEISIRKGSRKQSKLAGKPAEELIMEYKTSGRPMAGKLIVSLHDNVGVAIVMAGDAKTIEKQWKHVEAIRESFKVSSK